jgi:hypothetical protein
MNLFETRSAELSSVLAASASAFRTPPTALTLSCDINRSVSLQHTDVILCHKTLRPDTVAAMNYSRRLRETVDYWAKAHPGSGIEELAVNYFTAKDEPDDVVMVVIALEADQTDLPRMREIRNMIAAIGRKGAVGPIVVAARTLDSEIIVVGRRSGAANG